MKNLKKISRKDLKLVKGGGLGDCGAYFPTEPPLPGEPYVCDCNLVWCEKMGSCIHPSMNSPQRCDPL